jgi:hypothetical protein
MFLLSKVFTDFKLIWSIHLHLTRALLLPLALQDFSMIHALKDTDISSFA